MKRILIIAAAALAIVSCSQNMQKKDIAFLSDFYEHVLGNKPMTDDYLKSSVSTEILNTLWEADYDETYSFWYFRTGFQDGPSDVSEVEGIEPLGEGWYRVSYSDLGNPGVTDVKVEGGKITQDMLDKSNVKARVTYRPVLLARDGEMLVDNVGGASGMAEFIRSINTLQRGERNDNDMTAAQLKAWAKSLGWHRDNSTDFNLL